eukprot:g50417.t1
MINVSSRRKSLHHSRLPVPLPSISKRGDLLPSIVAHTLSHVCMFPFFRAAILVLIQSCVRRFDICLNGESRPNVEVRILRYHESTTIRQHAIQSYLRKVDKGRHVLPMDSSSSLQ